MTVTSRLIGTLVVKGVCLGLLATAGYGQATAARDGKATAITPLERDLVMGHPRGVASAPSLGTAQSFAVLGGSTVTNTGSSVITGDVGVWPGLAIVGFPPGTVNPPGMMHPGDAVAQQAQSDVTTAYNALAGEACDDDLTGEDLGGLTLTPGVYCFSSSAQLTGTLTLNAQGNPDALFIFQIGTTLTTASDSDVVFTNDFPTCNVFWQVGTSATLGTSTSFVGNILALASITLTTTATVDGRVLARNAAVTLDTNTIDASRCFTTTGTSTPTVTGTPPTATATRTSTVTGTPPTPTRTNTPTVTSAGGNLYEIPTLSGTGTALLVLLLLGMAAVFLVRHRG